MYTQKRLYRSRKDRMLGGVCAGIAEYSDFDPTVIRMVYVAITFFTAFAGIPAYFIMWLVIPKEPLEIE